MRGQSRTGTKGATTIQTRILNHSNLARHVHIFAHMTMHALPACTYSYVIPASLSHQLDDQRIEHVRCTHGHQRNSNRIERGLAHSGASDRPTRLAVETYATGSQGSHPGSRDAGSQKHGHRCTKTQPNTGKGGGDKMAVRPEVRVQQ